MATAAPALPSALWINRSLIVISLFAAMIAWRGPFDIAIDAATFGQPALRITLILAMISVGAACAQRSGLHIEGRGAARPVLVGVAAAFIVAVYIALVDGFLFRSILPQDYVQVFQNISLSRRLTYYFMRAYQESVIYRLFLFSVLLYVLTVIQRRAPPVWQVYTLAIGVQALNIVLNQIPLEPVSPQMLFYDAIRYGVPGSLWGWLYWRFGFSTLEIAHVGSHVFLQPALGIFIP